MVRWLLFFAAMLWASVALASEQPLYAPPAAWVKPIAIPSIPVSTDGSAVQVLLQNGQSRLGADRNEFYYEAATRIVSSQALAFMGNISLNWNPDTDTIIFHRVEIHRDGKVIDLISDRKKVSILRRETRLELSTLDGRLTATIQPEGLQVGDVVDLAVTIERHDPVYKRRSEALAAVGHVGTAGRVYIREVWPNTKPMRWRATEGLPKPVFMRGAETSELVIDRSDVVAPRPPAFAPERFQEVGRLEVADFENWQEVSALMAPLYAKAAKLAPDSPLRPEIERIRKLSADPKVRAEAVLRLVQDQIHYVALFLNFGGFVPAPADATWNRRFGDCKGKTALLLALLQELGIDAEPALVSTTAGDGLADRLPMLGSFDHVFVRATVKGKVYWLDGTRTGDRDLDDIPIPDFRWVLPVRSAGAALERLQPRQFDLPDFESVKRIDASAGFEAPAIAHVEYIFRGDAAAAWRLSLGSLGKADLDRHLREYWRGRLPWITPNTVAYSYDDGAHVARVTLDGQGKMDWSETGDYRDYRSDDSALGNWTSYRREPGPYADAPIAVNFPDFNRWTEIITLPQQGRAFELMGAGDLDQTIGARAYFRRSTLRDGVVTIVAQEKALASEFPYAEAETVSDQLRRIGGRAVVVRGRDEARFTDVGSEQEFQASDAAGFSRRGVARLQQRDYERAIADFTKAVGLEPREAKHLYNRAAAEVARGDDPQALRDLNAALQLDPDSGLYHMARAELRLRTGAKAAGWADFDRAVSLSPQDNRIRERRAAAYDEAGLYEGAVSDITAIVGSKPPRLADYLNLRCWYRAEWGRELEAALTDCNEALKLSPGIPEILDTRALVALRMGQFRKAIADYDSALALSPRLAGSLYGRGLARFAEGLKREAEADVAAALAIDPKADRPFVRIGLKAPGH